ncbi:MAG: lytic transglycosylase domain-containing protein [Paracoccaceae bacterium]|nr:MAG: lytic transglycosylase domain-containing protein [Paracoccaceae bacterium]
MSRSSWLLFAALATAAHTTVEAGPAALCEAAAATAAAETGVPLPILTAILAAESGRGRGRGPQGWPWALNAAGQGRHPSTEDEARRQLADLQAVGVTNIDVGCFQINLLWHGAAYPAAAALLDPLTNARHAAGYLRDLHARTGDWRRAAGQYHSRDPDRAESYVRRLEALHASAQQVVAEHEPPPAERRTEPLIRFDRRLRPLIGSGS